MLFALIMKMKNKNKTRPPSVFSKKLRMINKKFILYGLKQRTFISTDTRCVYIYIS